MRGNGKVFVCHAFQDNDRCKALLAALTSWDADFWFQVERDEADEHLSPRVEQMIAACDVFIRVCSPAAEKSHWVRLETEAFRRLQAEERASGEPNNRVLIFFGIDSITERPTLGEGDIFVDAAGVSLLRWRPELRHALGVGQPNISAPKSASGEAAAPPGDETAAMPRVRLQDTLDDLRALAEQLRLRVLDDSVVSVDLADRPMGESEGVGARPARLEMIEGRYIGRAYEVRGARVTLGRKLDRDIFIEDLAVSRRHAAIERDEQGRLVLHDENSTNGTYVNGRQITTERALEDGDVIRLGSTAFRIRLPRRDD